MKRLHWAALLAAAIVCGGCQSMKKTLNDTRNSPNQASRRTAETRASEPEIFPGSRKSSHAPSMLDGELSRQERAALDASMRDTHIPARDLGRQDKRDNKAESDWVFGR